MVFGFTTSFRMGQLIQFKLDVPKHDPSKTDFEYMVTDFIDAVKECFKDNEYAEVENSVVKGGAFMVGYNGTIYMIYSDFQVQMHAEPYDACGCGESYALGAMHALSGTKMSAKKRITAALDAASQFSTGVRGPYNFASV